jgi:hypothetical protein
MRRLGPLPLAIGLAAALLALAAPRAEAQDQGLRAVIEQIAGSDVYLSVGSEAGLAASDTVQAYRDGDGEYLGALRVVAVSASRSVVTFLDRPFPLTRGTVLQLRFTAAPAAAPAAAAAAPAVQTPTRSGPRVRGRFSLDFNGMQSTTTWMSNVEERVERRFASPSMSLRLVATQLPGGLTFETTGRATYRYSDPEIVQPDLSVRVYQVSIAKEFDNAPIQFRLGRFYNPYELYSGYWDGALLRVGGRGFGVGVVAGFQPDRANEGPSTDLPKYTAFADYAVGRRTVRYTGDLSFHQVRPKGAYLDHTFAGWSQALRVGGFRLASDLQVDRDPELSEWKLTRARVTAAVPLARGFTLNGRYVHDRPYFLFRTTDLLPFARDQVGGGFDWFGGNASFRADVTANRFDEGGWSMSYGGSFGFQRTGILGLGLNAGGTYWTLEGSTALQAFGDLTRRFGRVDVRGSYQFYRTEWDPTVVVTHTGGLSLTVPLGARVYTMLQARTQQGANLVSNSIQFSLSTSF